MDGIQKTLVLMLRKTASDLETGKYGEGADRDYDAFSEDIEEYITDVLDFDVIRRYGK